MRRLIGIALFLAGGFAAEWAYPGNCLLVCAGPVRLKRHDRQGGGVNDCTG
jgi:hypothetical protein